MGAYAPLNADEQTKTRCLDFVASMMGDKTDIAIMRQLTRDKDLVERNGVSMEITPPTADDAMGGWWVSVYFDEAIAKARASDEEMKKITVERAAIAKAKSDDAAAARKAAYTKTVAEADAEPSTSWTPSDLRYARASAGGGSGGSVYVHSYRRQDGTYVQSHTRSAPGLGHSGRH